MAQVGWPKTFVGFLGWVPYWGDRTPLLPHSRSLQQDDLRLGEGSGNGEARYMVTRIRSFAGGRISLAVFEGGRILGCLCLWCFFFLVFVSFVVSLCGL